MKIPDLLVVDGLRKGFAQRSGLAAFLRRREAKYVTALDGVNLTVGPHEVVGLVGESGSGKTTLARCLVRLVRADEGTATFDGQSIFDATATELRGIRQRMQLIFQDPYSSLNPRLGIGDAIGEPARVHGLVSGRPEEAKLVAELLAAVGLSARDAERRPRELSGGQRQRVAIARALASQPDLLIADEAVSALDVSVQAQILNLFGALSRDRGLAMIFISHQLAVVAQIAQRVAIMYLGRIIEIGTAVEIFSHPMHPYTAALLAAHPSVDRPQRRRAPTIVGELPSPDAVPTGCRFRSRCPLAEPICAEVDPPPVDLGEGHISWCHVLPRRANVSPQT